MDIYTITIPKSRAESNISNVKFVKLCCIFKILH